MKFYSRKVVIVGKFWLVFLEFNLKIEIVLINIKVNLFIKVNYKKY